MSFELVPGGLAAARIKVRSPAGEEQIPVAHEVENPDVVLMTLGSQLADMTVGKWDEAPGPSPHQGGALWKKIAARHPEFGRPERFFGQDAHGAAEWVTFTVTMYGSTFLDCLARLTGVDAGRAGLITLADSPWKTTIAPCPKPHFKGEPAGATVMWGYSIFPEAQVGGKEMWKYTGKEILTETVHELGFDDHLSEILAQSECVPCRLPHANSVWMTRGHADRPGVHSDSANFAFIGQFCELPRDTMFTMEYSIRSAREAVSALFKLPARRPPPVYQGWRDPAAMAAAVKTFVL